MATKNLFQPFPLTTSAAAAAEASHYQYQVTG